MVNARTLAVGTFAIVGAGVLAASQSGKTRYTKYQVAKDTTLYVNNDFTEIPMEKGLEIVVNGDVVPESGNAAFVEVNMGEGSRIVVSTSYDMMQEFQGETETSCSAFLQESHEGWLVIPEGAKTGDFSGYTLVNGQPSNGPVGANVDPRDCSSGREHREQEQKLYEKAIEMASEEHGIAKRQLWASCNVGRENAHLAYYDPEVGKHNQCKYLKKYESWETDSTAEHFTRVSGSQMDFFNFKKNAINTWADWGCNLGAGANQGSFRFIFFNLVLRDRGRIRVQKDHITEKGKGDWGAGEHGGRVKRCYGDYVRRSAPCAKKHNDADPSSLRRCVGHSLGGAVCAAGKGLDVWDAIIGFNPAPSVTKTFKGTVGKSKRYSFGEDIASFCLYKKTGGIEWGYEDGVRMKVEYEKEWHSKWVDNRFGRGRRIYRWYEKVPVSMTPESPWLSDSCVKGAFPLLMFSNHAISKENFRCPDEELTWTPAQQAWIKKFKKDPPTKSGPARR